MKILIGTPIHQVKDYSMERWLENVAKLLRETPADLLLVDNSPGLSYIEKIKGYLKKYGIKNYKIEHLVINQEQPIAERIGKSREIIRQEFLKGDYEAWFSWENDQIIPTDTLDILVKLMRAGNYTMIQPNAWSREVPTEPEANFGVCLVSRDALGKHTFMLIPPDDCWAGGEARFKRDVLKNGGSYIEVYGIISPIYHLNE